jgi:Gti1/Pac2 family
MPSFIGYVASTLDAALLMTAAADPNNDLVTLVRRRLAHREREEIRSGSTFVWDESSGMKRWTDGLRWSKSRVDGQFLVYSQLSAGATAVPVPQIPLNRKPRHNAEQLDQEDGANSEVGPSSSTSSTADSAEPVLLEEGVLMKRTFSLTANGVVTHVVRMK